MSTIRDVAKRASVSTYAVSAVLNQSAYVSPELTARIRTAVDELDYSVNDLARGVFTGKTKTVGMLIPEIGNPFYGRIVHGVEDVLRKSGYSLILGNTYNDSNEQSRYLTILRSKRVDGMLLFAAPGDQSELQRWVEAKRPTVFIARLPIDFEADAVTADHVAGSRMAINHLIKKGHRKIGLVTGHLSTTAGGGRLEGWRQALKAARLEPDSRYVAEADWTAQSGYQHAAKLLAIRPRPTAIFAANFVMMTGVLRAIQERGLRCPGQVEVMSSDDSEWLDVFRPRVSTVVQPSFEMGSEAAKLVLRRTRHPKSRFKVVALKSTLNIR